MDHNVSASSIDLDFIKEDKLNVQFNYQTKLLVGTRNGCIFEVNLELDYNDENNSDDSS